jgi:hypothetical protein
MEPQVSVSHCFLVNIRSLLIAYVYLDRPTGAEDMRLSSTKSLSLLKLLWLR